MVATSRFDKQVLKKHSEWLIRFLFNEDPNICKMMEDQNFDFQKYYKQFTNLEIDKVPHLIFPFHDLPEDWNQQIDIEFPHSYARSNQEFLRYFSTSIMRK